MTIFWVDPNNGSILGATSDDGEAPTPTAVAITTPAESGKQIWNFATNTWGPLPRPLADADIAERETTNSVIWKAWVRRQARREGKTPRQIIDELRSELP